MALDEEGIRIPKRYPPEPEGSYTEFFQDSAIVGDSITYIMYQYEAAHGLLGHPLFLARGGTSLNGFVLHYKNVFYQGQEMWLETAVGLSKVKKVFIMLGQNDLGYRTIDETFDSWVILLPRLREQNPDLVVLDVMLPGIDGTELLRRMRATPALRRVPVIKATARGAEYDRVQGLDSGADDYLTKPFSVIELVSRVRAVLRRCQPQEDTGTLRCGELTLGTAEHTVSVNGQRVDLTYKEYELLRLFMTHPGRAFTRDKLMELVWGTDYCGESRTVDMHIRTLRQKLGDAGTHIQTIRSVGYRWEDNT